MCIRDSVWTMQSREDELAYCQAHGINLPFDARHSYSRDRNLWHISHEGLELEDPSQAPNYDDMLVLSVTPQKAPDVYNRQALYLVKNQNQVFFIAKSSQPLQKSRICRINSAFPLNHLCDCLLYTSPQSLRPCVGTAGAGKSHGNLPGK